MNRIIRAALIALLDARARQLARARAASPARWPELSVQLDNVLDARFAVQSDRLALGR